MIPTWVGMRMRKHLAETLGALAVKLKPADVAALEEAAPASAILGARYPEAALRELDSER